MLALNWQEIKLRLQAVSPVYKFIALIISSALLLGLTFWIAGAISKRNYERQMNSFRGQIKTAKDAADKFKKDADLADQRAVAASNQLSIVNQRLADAQAQTEAAYQRTAQTKVVYVKSQTNPASPVALSGDNSIDRQRICTELGKLGHSCKQ